MNVKHSSGKSVDPVLIQLENEFSEELSSILEFWSSSCVDEKYGGFIGTMDHFGKIVPKASKGCILNARILWTFSAAFRMTKTEKYKALADRAYAYITDYFWDNKNGGLFWELDYLGTPLNTKKQAYAQGFGIYAFSEYYRATGIEASLEYAKELYNILDEKFWDYQFTGYFEAFTQDWQEIKDMRLSTKDLNAPKSMNTHLHILEPFTNLYRVWPVGKLKNSIQSLIQIFTHKIFDTKTNHLNLFFTKNWTSHYQEVSFGHDIEGAWLLNEAGMVINDGNLDPNLKSVTDKLIRVTIKEGLDSDGSIFYERHGSNLDTHKHWWPQAEGLVGFMDAYEHDRDKEYLDRLVKLWEFIKINMIDKVNGEWYWSVDQQNIPVVTENKAGFWKCPYHNGRAMMELIERIDKMKSAS